VNTFLAAFWAETLKARRSRVSLGITAAVLILPLVGGLFMIILKNPERAQALGLISVKAQLAGGVADWSTFFDLLLQGTAVGGAMLFAFVAAWVFGREFSDRTAKELLAIPTPRAAIVAAKFALVALWILGLALLSFGEGLAVAAAVDIPGWSPGLARASLRSLGLIAVLHLMLTPLVAFFASAGRGYLPPLGWALLTLAAAQVMGVLGWGDWFPWTVPALASGMMGPRAEVVGVHSYGVVVLACIVGVVATFVWWRSADQAQ
jgi:ABC-2 type transport system permease protein